MFHNMIKLSLDLMDGKTYPLNNLTVSTLPSLINSKVVKDSITKSGTNFAWGLISLWSEKYIKRGRKSDFLLKIHKKNMFSED